MSHTIKRREFLALAGATGAALVGISSAEPVDATSPPALSPTTPEGYALISLATATVGYQLTEGVAADVRKKLGNYPGGFASARAVSLPQSVQPSMSYSPYFKVARRKPESAKAKDKPKPAANGAAPLPSTTDVKPLPVPPGTVQN